MLPVRSRFLPLKQLKASLFFQRHHAPTDSRQRISQLFCRSRHTFFPQNFCQFLHLSLPLIFGNILQQFYNTIDAFVVGYFSGTDEFAAIGIAGRFFI